MNKNEIFTHYASILDKMLDSSNWFRVYFQQPWSFSVRIDKEDAEELPDNISVDCGATRGCIIDNEYDWVVKYDIEEDYDYGSACSREVDIYEAAKEQNLDEYFTPAIYLGTYKRVINYYPYEYITREIDLYDYDENQIIEFINNNMNADQMISITIYLPLYAYRRARFNFHAVSDKSRRQVKTLSGPLTYNLTVGSIFLDCYGTDEWDTLNDFLSEWDVNDLHQANIGIINDKVCLIDFAGYHDC